MRIVQINACRDYMSTGVIVKAIGETARKNGIEMYYAYQTCKDTSSDSYQIGNHLDWKLHALWNRIIGREGYASYYATQKFLRWLDEVQPDVVHLHNLHSHYVHFNLLCRYLAEKRIATVITLHDCWYFTGKCSHYAAVDCQKWQTRCSSCPQLKTEVPSWFTDPTATVHKDRIAHLNAIENLYIVGCSKWVSGEAEKSLLKPRNIRTIYNGVDLAVFKPHASSFRQKYALEHKFVVLGMAGKWADPSNRDAVKHIVRTLDGDAVIVVAGCTEAQKAYLSQFGGILTVGYLNKQADMAELYAAADVFVNLTHADTLPTVNMEAIACGTPVITYNSCGSPELVLEDCGYVVPDGDYKAIAECIAKVKETPCTGMSAAREAFDKSKNYQQYIALYREAARSNK